jgi:hypothetical protein
LQTIALGACGNHAHVEATKLYRRVAQRFQQLEQPENHDLQGAVLHAFWWALLHTTAEYGRTIGAELTYAEALPPPARRVLEAWQEMRAPRLTTLLGEERKAQQKRIRELYQALRERLASVENDRATPTEANEALASLEHLVTGDGGPLRESLTARALEALSTLQPNPPDELRALVEKHWFYLCAAAFREHINNNQKVSNLLNAKLLANLTIERNGDRVAIPKPDEALDQYLLEFEARIIAAIREEGESTRSVVHEESSHTRAEMASGFTGLREDLLPHIRAAIPPELPPAAEEFFGRELELKQLTERLRAGKNTAVVGLAGLGKTALAAEALRAVVGHTPETLLASPFPDGVVFLDLYTFHGEAEPAWGTLANKLAGAGFMERSPARDRATEACRGKRLLVVIEGGEEADGKDGRADINELFSVLSPQNRRLLLTRPSIQSAPAASIELKDALGPEDAEQLLDSLTAGHVTADVRDRVLTLLEGHPLALTWAGNLLKRDYEDPKRLADDWEAEQLPSLSDPERAEHTLRWLFGRSVRGLDDDARRALEAAGLLARAPFPLAAIAAVLGESDERPEKAARDALKVLVQRGLLRLAEAVDHWEFTHVLGYRFARKESDSDAVIRKRLGGWLHEHLTTSLTGEDVAEAGPLLLTRALEHLAALLRADDEQVLWLPLANGALHDFTDRLTHLGRLGFVMLGLDAVVGWMERFPPDKAEETVWLRMRAVLSSRQGDVRLAQGDLTGAEEAYGEALALMRRLREVDPSNAV